MKTNPDPVAHTPKDLLNELQALVVEAEAMMAGSSSEPSAEGFGRLQERFDVARQRLAEICAATKTKLVAGAKCTDEAIRGNPYQALAIAGGLGLLLGVLFGRRSR